jgi:tRNA/tmRNA/rRNA uracil-C5-methylase (TrmA/RlmC/RlmD family)
VFTRCGGCQYQHVTPARQVALKTDQLLQTLRRVGRLDVTAIDEVIAAPDPWAYRNRVVVHATADGQGTGFHATDGRTILPLTDCPIAHPAVAQAMATAAQARGDSRSVAIRHAPGSGVHCTPLGAPPTDGAVCQDEVNGLPYAVPLGSFAQVHPAVAGRLTDLVARWVAPLPPGPVVDAYCGAGFLGLAITDRAVLGLEVDAASIACAETNAAARGLTTSHRYRSGPVEAHLAEALSPATGLLLDPPRAGCSPACLDLVIAATPAWILYVSCEPSTLARDLVRLTAAGYRCERTALLDMFPQTAHFESAVLLRRQ